MRVKEQISTRIKAMLTHDNFDLDEGFMTAFQSDVTHLLGDYFDLQGDVQIDVKLREDGKYALSVCAVAGKVNRFETTINN